IRTETLGRHSRKIRAVHVPIVIEIGGPRVDRLVSRSASLRTRQGRIGPHGPLGAVEETIPVRISSCAVLPESTVHGSIVGDVDEAIAIEVVARVVVWITPPGTEAL